MNNPIYLADMNGAPLDMTTFATTDDAFDYAEAKGLEPNVDVLICGEPRYEVADHRAILEEDIEVALEAAQGKATLDEAEAAAYRALDGLGYEGSIDVVFMLREVAL